MGSEAAYIVSEKEAPPRRALPRTVLRALRFPIACGLGVVVTGAMFGALSTLINVQLARQALQPLAKIEFTRLRHETEARTIKRDKPQLEKPVQAPANPQVARITSSRSGTEAVAASMLAPPGIDAHAVLGGLAVGQGVSLGGGSDRDTMPLVRVNPEYPPRALARGTQGWVVIQFTISAAGTVKDAKVVEAEPEGIFDEAALKAVAHWKYAPMVEEGVAVERRGVQVKLTFQLES